VDRFVWKRSTLTQDITSSTCEPLQPAFEREPTPAAGRGNHDGGVIKFGPDGTVHLHR